MEERELHGRPVKEMTPYFTLATRRDLQEPCKGLPFEEVSTSHLDFSLGYLIATKVIIFISESRIKILKFRGEKPQGEVNYGEMLSLIDRAVGGNVGETK